MQAARIRKRRLAPKDARCRASAFEQKTGGRDGLPSGKPLRRLRRAYDNNEVLRHVNVIAGRPPLPVQRQPRPLDRPNNIRPQRRRGAPQARPSRPRAVLIRLRLAFLNRTLAVLQ